MTHAIETCWSPNAAKPLILCGSERSSCTPRCHRTSADAFLHSQSSSLAWFCTRTRRITYNFLFVLPKRIKIKITKRRKNKTRDYNRRCTWHRQSQPWDLARPPNRRQWRRKWTIDPPSLLCRFALPRRFLDSCSRSTGDHPQEEWAK